MFKKGEYVVHGRSGVCVIDEITTIDISEADKDQKYYVGLRLGEEGLFPV